MTNPNTSQKENLDRRPYLKLTELRLEDYWGISEMILSFDPRLTVIIGENGAGKTTILNALSKAFKLVEDVTKSKTNINAGNYFSSTDIQNGQNEASVRIKAILGFEAFSFSQESRPSGGKKRLRGEEGRQTKAGFIPFYNEEFALDYSFVRQGKAIKISQSNFDIDRLEHFSRTLNHILDRKREEKFSDRERSLPIVVFYPCERTSDIQLTIDRSEESQNSTDLFSAWDNALSSNAFDYREFFLWFRQQYGKSLEGESDDRELAIFEQVKGAIYDIFGDDYFNNLKFSWLQSKEGDIYLYKGPDKESINMSQLSSGEKNLMLLVADLARRLVLANPDSDEPVKEGNAIVMIDELGLHLHPGWQRMVIPKLLDIFPKVQFIITTHSPQVLQSVKKEQLRVLSGGQVLEEELYIEGRDANSILEDVFGVSRRLAYDEDTIDRIYDLIDNEKIQEAIVELEKLKKKWSGNDLEINRIQGYIDISE